MKMMNIFIEIFFSKINYLLILIFILKIKYYKKIKIYILYLNIFKR